MKYLQIEGDWLPALGLGTYQLSGAECIATVELALELGYRHIDTAELYGNEAQIGRAIRASGIPRRELWLTSKVWLDNLGHGDVMESVIRSLGRLGFGQLDLLLVHWPGEVAPLEEALAAMLLARERGLTRHLGVSNMTRAQLSRALKLAPLVCNQVEYHPFLSQKSMLSLVEHNQLVLAARCPLARGRVMTSPRLQQIGAVHGKSAAQIALAWLMQQERVAGIPTATQPEHLVQNLEIFDFELTDDELRRICALHRGQRLGEPRQALSLGS